MWRTLKSKASCRIRALSPLDIFGWTLKITYSFQFSSTPSLLPTSCYGHSTVRQKITCKCFLLWLSSIYTHFTWFFVLASLHHPQLFPLWMGTFSTHRFTHFTFHFRGKIFSSQIAKDLRSLATANENYLCQLKLRETLWATRMRKGDTGRPHGVGRKIQELRLLFLFFPVVLTFF